MHLWSLITKEIGMIKLATWNVNSLKVRLPQVLDWLSTSEVDILAIQETKIVDTDFPLQVFKDLGYFVSYSGQKTYNGVAIISRRPQEAVLTAIPNFNDPQRRFLAVTIAGLRLINIYVPNGSLVDSDKYAYKLHWLEQLTQFLNQERQRFPHIALVGDFNIAPEDRDVHDPKAWEGSVLVSPRERQAFTEILKIELHDSFRHFPQEGNCYTWWDYRAGSFRRNWGLRIDHILLSTPLLNFCHSVLIDKEVRKNERPSDHSPVICTLNTLFDTTS